MALTEPEIRTRVLAGHVRLRALLDGVTEDAVRGPSALPGWTRGHVLSHIEGIGVALARQARYAMRDELVEVYDGGRPARDAAIEAGASRTAAVLRAAVHAALDEAETAWAAVGPGDWGRAVRYRDADLRAALECWWRELGIHTADAELGDGPGAWSRELCVHLLDFLAPRAPAGLTLVAADGPERRAYGEDAGAPATVPATVTVTGRLTDLAAWLAGREPAGRLDGPLPGLRPWP